MIVHINRNISNAYRCFYGSTLTKNVYIPFASNEDTTKTLYCLYDRTNDIKFYVDIDPTTASYSTQFKPVYKEDGTVNTTMNYIRNVGSYYQATSKNWDYHTCYKDPTNNVNLIIPAGTPTQTYNTFINAGYDENGTTNGVYLKNLNEVNNA